MSLFSRPYLPAMFTSATYAGVRRRQRGFTLLEVLVALAIVSMVLGSLFALLGGSRRLAWKSARAVEETLSARSLLYAVSLGGASYADFLPFDPGNYSLRTEKVLPPERKTRPMRHELVREIVEIDGEEFVLWRWRTLRTPR